MHASSVRPQTKFAAALVAAGVVSAASLGGVAENRSLPVLNIDVAKASVITDVLYGLGDAVNGVATGFVWIGDGAGSLPFDATAAIAVALQNPSLAPNLLTWLLQRYVNPSVNYPNFTYPYEVKVGSIEPLAQLLLPAALSDAVINGVNGISDAINDILAVLPTAVDDSVVGQFTDTDIGQVVLAANLAVTAPVWILYNTAYYLGYLPANLEATLESAIQEPSEIPGLLSNLVYGLLAPTPYLTSPMQPGLLGDVLGNLTAPLTTLPGPIGELATNVVTAVANSLNNVLALLPTPISPTPFPSALKSAVVADTQVAAVPEESLDANTITLSSVDPVEKKADDTDSTVSTPEVTPKDDAPAAGDDADATPPADTNTPEVKPDKPATDPVKSGNKVKPGDKFSQTKGDAAKGDAVKGEDGGTTPTTPAGDGAVAGEGADPTGTPAGATDNAPDSGANDASGAAA